MSSQHNNNDIAEVEAQPVAVPMPVRYSFVQASLDEVSNREEDNEQFNQAFGQHINYINAYFRNGINLIKDNCANLKTFKVNDHSVLPRQFTDLVWTLIGRYIANNTHLEELDLKDCCLTDEMMALLFRELNRSSLKKLNVSYNPYSVDGLRHMVPLLQNSPKLSALYFNRNDNINTECFEVLKHTYDLPHLKQLVLSENNIGREGCIVLSNILQKDDTTLEALNLDNIDIDDEGAEILAHSLKRNTKLNALNVRNNGISEKGCKAFLKLLVDISSIENTYNSNHTLTTLWINTVTKPETNMIMHVQLAIQMNQNHPIFRHAVGRAKVIDYQLHSQNRKDMCCLQGVEYSSGDNMLAGVEPKLLGTVLELIGRKHGKSELYTALIPMVSDLMSFIDVDRKVILKDRRDKLEAQRTALTAEYVRKMALLNAEVHDINSRLALIEVGDNRKQSAVDGGKVSGEKRQRIN